MEARCVTRSKGESDGLEETWVILVLFASDLQYELYRLLHLDIPLQELNDLCTIIGQMPAEYDGHITYVTY